MAAGASEEEAHGFLSGSNGESVIQYCALCWCKQTNPDSVLQFVGVSLKGRGPFTVFAPTALSLEKQMKVSQL